ncbi:hypothetical protein F1559_000026 [Cyanidiococcus yangmingshanensis]|uniref:Hint domain-containing protein n=1 Tax=Cyanidiococcus yangmingshanensis TaxID=2690220 RepID=A0A7J7IEU5_9RHOD|nr:hypothetical protein F1559_000026 [Cyanidiococcus yangmingshanensis]
MSLAKQLFYACVAGFLVACLFVNFAGATPVNTVSWTWIGGKAHTYGAGSYGTKGSFSKNNTPGARHGAVGWTGASELFYLFGGEGLSNNSISGYLNDLWVFDKSSLEWKWIGGSAASGQSGTYGTLGQADSSNIPGARSEAAFWQLSTTLFYLFGGYGYDGEGDLGHLNDMWLYNAFSGEWTWLAGNDSVDASDISGSMGSFSSSFSPGARKGASFWTDMSGNLWLFGGLSHSFQVRSDLWMFNTSASQWGWIGGPLTSNNYGNYSAPGAASSSNAPGARYFATTWVDQNNNLWLFGGLGFGNSTQKYGLLNDLWMYNITSGMWTFVIGGTTTDNFGTYGVFGQYSASNMPGGRWKSASFVDSLGNLQLFGGAGLAASSSLSGFLNDLWVFDPNLGQWAWINGSSSADAVAFYGTLNESSAAVRPGGRYGSTLWAPVTAGATFAAIDPVLFGGWGYANGSVPARGNLNDVFSFSEVFASPYPSATPIPTPTPTPTLTTMPTPIPEPEPAFTDGSAVCFPADASVLIDDENHVVPMRGIRPGMQVMGADQHGRLVPDTVLSWLHYEPSAVGEVLVIATASGKRLRLTRHHLVYRLQQQQQQQKDRYMNENWYQRRPGTELGSAFEAVYAERVRVDDALYDAVSRSLDRVVSIESAQTLHGLYAPLTRTGRLVVDGLLVSCYGTYPSHAVSHAVLWPARVDTLRGRWASLLGIHHTQGIMPYAAHLYGLWTSIDRMSHGIKAGMIAAAC